MFSYETDGFKPGWIFILPPYSTALDDPDWHPYYLLTHCAPDGFGTLAFGSTQATEKNAGAPCHRISPQRTGTNANALEKPTYFYPVALAQMEHANLPRPTHERTRGSSQKPSAGKAFGQLRDLRKALRTSLGIGTGPAASERSWRGRIVAVDDVIYDDTGIRYAVILTTHEYSQEENYQILLPLQPGNDTSTEPSVVRVTQRSWIDTLGPHVKTALLPVPFIFSVWHEDHIIEDMGRTIDDVSLRQVEANLCTCFEL